MVMTVAIYVGVIALLVAIVAVIVGLVATHNTKQELATIPMETAKPQQPATATAQLQSSLPAASSPSTPAAATPTPAPAPSAKPVADPALAAKKVESGSGIVVIDAGHQGKGDNHTEPLGPGSSEKKPKVSSGASGVATGADESVVNLKVALKLRDALQARGVTVVMIRTTQNVNISNATRAKLANEANADLFIRLHCDSAGSSVSGVLTEIPAKDWYSNHPIVATSKVAGGIIHSAVLRSTGAKDRGIRSVGDLTGFNWSQVPSVLVEMGLLSNKAEDRKLNTVAYEQQLADGMADGIVEYLKKK
jgi:N-acetylmuramoyl-L-alanine amidase